MRVETRPHRRADRPPALKLEQLCVDFIGRRGRARAVDGVSLEVWPGEIVGLIGESGSGKTTIALSALGLLPHNARIVAGELFWNGQPLARLPEAEWRKIRGDRIALVPQHPMTAMNPVLPVGMQVGEPFVLHRKLSWREALERAVRLLASVHLPSPQERAREFPHQFSGGMIQRAMVATGIALEPDLLIADEPTTALDVTIQAQVLRLLREIRDEHGTALLFVTHDLGVVADMCDWVYVMYAGRILEEGPVERIFARPAHPYTQALLRATPTVDIAQTALVPIPGRIPSPFELPRGCRFADRCEYRFARCDEEPPLQTVSASHSARCWLVEQRHE